MDVRERSTGALLGLAVVGVMYGVAHLPGYSGWIAAAVVLALAGWSLGGQIRRLERLAERDALTGVCNRRPFEQRLLAEWERSLRTGHPLSLLFLDIDDFGMVNKTFGHMMGDEVLRVLTRQLRQSLRRYDVVARWGGEEFVVLLPETDSAAAVAIAERIRSVIQNTAVRDRDAVIAVTVSLGVSTCPGSARTARELLRHAITAQQQAKAHKNAVSIVS